MKISFEYQNTDRDWHRISITYEIEPHDVDQKLNILKRQFPACALRALDENNQVIAILYQT